MCSSSSNLVLGVRVSGCSAAERDEQPEAGDTGAEPAAAAPPDPGPAAPAGAGERHGGDGEGAAAADGGAASAGGGPEAAAGKHGEAAQVQQALPGCESSGSWFPLGGSLLFVNFHLLVCWSSPSKHAGSDSHSIQIG